MTEPPADILGRLRPIPTTVGPPTTHPRDVSGVAPNGHAVRIDVVEATAPVLLLFLSADCLGCRDLWAGLTDLQAGLGRDARLAVVTKEPPAEDPAAIVSLAGDAHGRLRAPVVMSTIAYADYRAAAPFLALATPDAVLVEGVAWGVEETLHTARSALAASAPAD
ncbi:MAG TPA: hypothetical protein VG244_00235 [Acidimicrobiales bacterium]|nr:hypothetical protein [Acidimicrobiales bacterium]